MFDGDTVRPVSSDPLKPCATLAMAYTSDGAYDRETYEANARLIAQAPALLAALEFAEEALREGCGEATRLVVIRDACAAIAAARGQS